MKNVVNNCNAKGGVTTTPLWHNYKDEVSFFSLIRGIRVERFGGDNKKIFMMTQHVHLIERPTEKINSERVVIFLSNCFKIINHH